MEVLWELRILWHILSTYFLTSLHSHKLQWGTGSHQQSVTAVSESDDTNSLWLLKEAYRELPIQSGKITK